MRTLAISLLLIAVPNGPVLSQRVSTLFPTHYITNAWVPNRAASSAPEPGILSPILAAAGLGLLGWAAGALIGHAVQGECTEDLCELRGLYYGGATGAALGLAAGAHLGNRRRGSFWLDLGTSALVWAGGFAVMATSDESDVVVATAILLPPAQLLSTVLVERATGRSRERRAQAGSH